MRKPIQITITSMPAVSGEHDMHAIAVALCDDGSLWECDLLTQNRRWALLPDIPQDDEPSHV